MIRWALLFFLCIVIFPSISSGQISPFFNGKWVKIAATKQGVYQVTGAQLKTMGFTIPFASSQVQLYNYNLANLIDKVVANPKVGIFSSEKSDISIASLFNSSFIDLENKLTGIFLKLV